MRNTNDPLQRLAVADPGLSTEVSELLEAAPSGMDPVGLASLVEDTIWGLSLEVAFGRNIALGYSRLIGQGRKDLIDLYATTVKKWGAKGPTVGRIMAEYLATVLLFGSGNFLQQYLNTFRVMHHKGTYTLKGPLEGLAKILETGDKEAGCLSGASVSSLLSRHKL